MKFLHPLLLWLAAIPLFLLLADAWGRRARAAGADEGRKILGAIVGADRAQLSHREASLRRRIRWRLALGLALAAVAVARPQWGRVEEPVFDQAREILVAIDLSRSMLADDIRPTRLDRARLLTEGLLQGTRGERVGLLVFAGTAFLQSPLSADHEILREFLPELNPGFLPEHGTNYTALLKTALTAFSDSSADRFLVVLSDGEASDDAWKAFIDPLKKRGIRVLALGVGTAKGAILADGNGGVIKDGRGAAVLSKLEDATLRELAQATNGVYLDASQWVDLPALIKETVDRGRRGDFKESGHARYIERYQWALAPALFFLLWSFWREFPVRVESRTLRRRQVSALFLGGILTLGILGKPPPASATGAENSLPGLVEKLAKQPERSAGDYADLAGQTIAYAKAHTAQIPEGILRDGLRAVERGRALDAKAADWDALETQLRALSKPPPEQKQPPQDSDQNQQDKPRQDQNSQNGSSSKSGQDQQGDSSQTKPGEGKSGAPDKANSPDQARPENANGSGQDKGKPQNENPEDGSQSPQSPSRSGQSSEPQPDQKSSLPRQQAFPEQKDLSADDKAQPKGADSAASQAPEENAGDMQTVGGADNSTAPPDAAMSPQMLQDLQRLDRVKANDSPARLFQLLQPSKDGDGEHAPSPDSGQTW